MVYPRGGGRQLAEVEWSSLDWHRKLDDISTAQIKVAGISGRSSECCGIVSSIDPWIHEIGLIRTVGSESFRVWAGPVQNVSFDQDTATIDCSDLAIWLTRRRLRDDHNYTQVDLAVIFADYVYDAMIPENSAGLHVATSLCGVKGDRQVYAAQHLVAYDQLSELARTGIDWTVIDRYMLAGGLVLVNDPIATLVDEHFAVNPASAKDGTNASTYWGVSGGGSTELGDVVYGAAGGIDSDYGLIERLVREDSILDSGSAAAQAASRLSLTRGSPPVISKGTLAPGAPLDLGPLVAGSPVVVKLSQNCVPVNGTYRLSQIDVSVSENAAEKVDVSFQPLGTVDS